MRRAQGGARPCGSAGSGPRAEHGGGSCPRPRTRRPWRDPVAGAPVRAIGVQAAPAAHAAGAEQAPFPRVTRSKTASAVEVAMNTVMAA